MSKWDVPSNIPTYSGKEFMGTSYLRRRQATEPKRHPRTTAHTSPCPWPARSEAQTFGLAPSHSIACQASSDAACPVAHVVNMLSTGTSRGTAWHQKHIISAWHGLCGCRRSRGAGCIHFWRPEETQWLRSCHAIVVGGGTAKGSPKALRPSAAAANAAATSLRVAQMTSFSSLLSILITAFG